MKKVAKKILWTTCVMSFVCIFLMIICNQIVVNNAQGKVFSDIDSIKYNKVGLLLGTTPQARIGRIKNYFFIYRIDAAEEIRWWHVVCRLVQLFWMARAIGR